METAMMVAVPEIRQMAEAAARSGLFPSLKTPEAAFTLMMLCQAEGLHPIQALRRFDIVSGRPAMKADAMLGEFQTRGGQVEWHQHDAEACRATFAAPGLTKPVTVVWTMEDAKRAGLAGKPGPWQQYPRQMLRARVISEGIRMAMPAVVVGLYAPEEVADFAPAPMAAQPAQLVAVPPPAPVEMETGVIEEPAPVEMATPAQVRALNAGITALGIKERDAKLAWLSAEVGRAIGSSKELTAAEASAAIETARNEGRKE